MKTRSPIYAQAFGHGLAPSAPLSIPTNRYPHSSIYHEGHIYLSSVGGNYDYPGGTVWVSGSAKVEKFDCLTGQKVGEAVIGPYESAPGSGIYLNGCGGLCFGAGSIWVAQSLGAGEVVRVDPATMAIQTRITVGAACRDAWWDGTKVWATVGALNKVVRIDPATNCIDLNVATAAKPFRGGFDGTSIWIACFDGGCVQKINPATGAVLATIATAAGANSVWCETDRIFVGNYSADSVSCLNPTTDAVLWTVPTGTGSRPHGLLLIDEELWICCSGDHYVRVYNVLSKAWQKAIAVPPNPPWPCFDGSSVWHGCGNANVLMRHPIKSAWN